MKKLAYLFAVAACLILVQSTIYAQGPKRTDVIWARTVPGGTINFDGKLDETAWAKAEQLTIKYGESAGLPTSGWRPEAGPDVYTDPTNATVKFLASENYIYIGFDVPDKWVGGTQDWARWDAVLMSLKDKSTIDGVKQALPAELFYTFWTAANSKPDPVVGGTPYFWSGNTDQKKNTGRLSNDWGNVDAPRTPAMSAVWDAKFITVGGTSNDAAEDVKWTCEMRIDVSKFGYKINTAAGDFVMLNFSIWDADYVIGNDAAKIAASRTWWQSPWANANANNTGQVYVRPDVGLNAALPDAAPDVVLPNGVNFADPTIDGKLDEKVWRGAYTWEMGWDSQNLRATYPGIGPWMSGQFQPDFGKPTRPPVLDPSKAKLYMFFKGKYLYFAADVNDQLVQGTDEYDATDGIMLNIMDRAAKNDDNIGIFQKLRISFDKDKNPKAYDYLTTLMSNLAATWAVTLKPGTTVNKNDDVDKGYMIEMKIDLTKLGYTADLGDKLLFMGLSLFDGDSFDDPLNNYGTRTWWFREHDGGPAAAWAYMDPANILVGVNDQASSIIPTSLKLFGNYPNPFNPTTKIQYALPSNGDVTLKVYNMLGEEVASQIFSSMSAGTHEYNFNAKLLSSGVYFYRLFFKDTNTGLISTSSSGKMILMK